MPNSEEEWLALLTRDVELRQQLSPGPHNERDLRKLAASMVHIWPVVESLRSIGLDVWRLPGIENYNDNEQVHNLLVAWLPRLPDASAAKQLVIKGLVNPRRRELLVPMFLRAFGNAENSITRHDLASALGALIHPSVAGEILDILERPDVRKDDWSVPILVASLAKLRDSRSEALVHRILAEPEGPNLLTAAIEVAGKRRVLAASARLRELTSDATQVPTNDLFSRKDIAKAAERALRKLTNRVAGRA